MCVCVYCYSVWVFSKSTVVKSFIILLPTAVIIETDCLVGPRLGGSKLGGCKARWSKAQWSKARWSKVNTYLHYLLPAWAHFNEAINTCVMFRKPR